MSMVKLTKMGARSWEDVAGSAQMTHAGALVA